MRVNRISVSVAIVALGVAIALGRGSWSEPDVAPAPPSPADAADAERAAAPSVPTPEAMRSGEEDPARPSPPASEASPSFESLVATYSSLSDEQMSVALEEVHHQIESGELVRRANEEDLDEREREELRLLLRRHGALQAARVQRLIDEADAEGI